jgi:hypothetical protein
MSEIGNDLAHERGTGHLGRIVKALLVAAGLAQLVLATGSLAIPRVLGWRDETAKLRPLTRQVFWTYASYIWVTNVAFGVLSTFCPTWLLDRSPLARAVAGFITAYWGARAIVQFFYFDRASAPQGPVYRTADYALSGLFVFLTAVYAFAAIGVEP